MHSERQLANKRVREHGVKQGAHPATFRQPLSDNLGGATRVIDQDNIIIQHATTQMKGTMANTKPFAQNFKQVFAPSIWEGFLEVAHNDEQTTTSIAKCSHQLKQHKPRIIYPSLVTALTWMQYAPNVRLQPVCQNPLLQKPHLRAHKKLSPAINA